VADDTRLLIAAGFNAEEVRRVERAAARESMVPIDWLRHVARELTDDLERRRDEDRAGEDDAGMPGKGAPDGEGGQERTMAVPIAIGADAAILERLDRLPRTLDEVCLWAQTVLSELYAHTGFADAKAKQVAREKAVAKFERIKAGVDAMMTRGDGAGR
jgi:hypothetical protein